MSDIVLALSYSVNWLLTVSFVRWRFFNCRL